MDQALKNQYLLTSAVYTRCGEVKSSTVADFHRAQLRDEQSHIFETPTPLLLYTLRLLLQLQKFLKHQLQLLITLRKLRSKKILSILPHETKYRS